MIIMTSDLIESVTHLQPLPICLCGHSMLLASDSTAPMRCPCDAHADVDRAVMVHVQSLFVNSMVLFCVTSYVFGHRHKRHQMLCCASSMAFWTQQWNPHQFKFALAQDRSVFIKCCVCHEFLHGDFGWRCGGCNTTCENGAVDDRGCGFVCCDDCKKTRASRWVCCMTNSVTNKITQEITLQHLFKCTRVLILFMLPKGDRSSPTNTPNLAELRAMRQV